jgi:hypothetical protein
MTTSRPDRLDPIHRAIALLMLWPILPAASGQDDLGPLPSEPRFEAILIEGPSVTGRVHSLSPDGGAILVEEDGDERVIGPGALFKLSRESWPPREDRPDASVLVFPGFEQLRGLIDSADERTILVRSPILGELQVPLDTVLGFTAGPSTAPDTEDQTISILRAEPRTSDLLLLENGDRRGITFSAMTDEVSYLDADRALKLPRRTVRAVGLDPGMVRLPEVISPSLDLLLTDGSRLRLLGATVSGGRLSGRTTFGPEVELGLNDVSECYILGGSISFLSDLEATREVTIPYVGPVRSVVPNGSVLGGPLSVGGRRYSRGLGTQSRSLLAYRLGPDALRFQAMVAMDDEAGPRGNVVFRVLVDGEERFASPPMTVGADPIPIDVDLAGGQFLILATEFGQGGGIRDYANWIEARLVLGRSSMDEDPELPGAGN